jgi:CRISPR/Cas system-associated exonuclease Cas4 (RecB family)
MNNKLSPSSISTYLQCPRKFYYTYIAKLPSQPIEALEEGGDIHKIIEHYYSLPLPDALSQNDIILNLSKAINDVVGEVNENVKKKLMGFVEFEKKRVAWKWRLVGCEQEVENEYIRGVVDAVFKKQEETYIVDWKSGYNISLTNDYIFQLSVYRWLLKANKSYIVFLSSTYNNIREVPIIPEDKVVRIVSLVKEALEGETVFERKLSRYCEYCPFNLVCNFESLRKEVRDELFKI